MKTTCIDHPAGDFFVRMSAWQIQAADGDHCGAALLSLFEYWHNNRLEAAQQAAKLNDIKERLGDARDQSEILTQYHNGDQLRQSLLGLYSEDTIRASIRTLVKKGFLRVFSNPNPRYAFDRTLHFEFMPETVNKWLKVYEPTAAQTTRKKAKTRVIAHSVKIGNAYTENLAPSPINLEPCRKKPFSPTKETKEETNECTTSAPTMGETVSVSLPKVGATGVLPGIESEVEQMETSPSQPKPEPLPKASSHVPPKIKKERSPVQEFVELWKAEWRNRTGTEYKIRVSGENGHKVALDYVQGKNMLNFSHKTPAELIEVVKAAWNNNAGWNCQNRTNSIVDFYSHWNEITVELNRAKAVGTRRLPNFNTGTANENANPLTGPGSLDAMAAAQQARYTEELLARQAAKMQR